MREGKAQYLKAEELKISHNPCKALVLRFKELSESEQIHENKSTVGLL